MAARRKGCHLAGFLHQRKMRAICRVLHQNWPLLVIQMGCLHLEGTKEQALQNWHPQPQRDCWILTWKYQRTMMETYFLDRLHPLVILQSPWTVHYCHQVGSYRTEKTMGLRHQTWYFPQCRRMDWRLDRNREERSS